MVELHLTGDSFAFKPPPRLLSNGGMAGWLRLLRR